MPDSLSEQNGNAPALSTMAANGRVRAKWECPSAQRDGSEWPNASKIGMPQRSARWQQMAAREQNGNAPALSAMAEKREQNGNAPAVSAIAANGRARTKWNVPWCNGSEWPQRNKQQSKEGGEGIGVPRCEGRRGRDPRSRDECQ